MDSPVFKSILTVFGLIVVFAAGWALESNYAPIISHYWTPDSASDIDKHLLEGARHVAPLKYKKWLEEQMEARAEQSGGETATPYDQYGYVETLPLPAHGQTLSDDGRQRMLVNR